MFVLSFDLPRNMSVVRTRINRRLHKAGAKRIHDSLWSCDDLQALMEIALTIKRFGGSARILEERFVF